MSCARNAAGWRPEALRLHGLLAWLLGDSALAQLRWRQSIAAAEALGFNVEKALTLLEMGKRLGNAALVDEATAVFAQTGAKVYLAFGLHAQAALAMQSGSEIRSVLQRYDQAISALDEVGAEYDLGVACRQRAHLHQQLGQTDCARADLEKARSCFEAVGAPSEQAETEREAMVLR